MFISHVVTHADSNGKYEAMLDVINSRIIFKILTTYLLGLNISDEGKYT